MKVKVRYLKESKDSELLPYAVKEANIKPGDLSYNRAGIICQANQSTCIFFEVKVIGQINKGVEVSDNEDIEILFKCAKKSECTYPFCGGSCGGNEGFYVAGKEERGY